MSPVILLLLNELPKLWYIELVFGLHRHESQWVILSPLGVSSKQPTYVLWTQYDWSETSGHTGARPKMAL